MPGEYALYYLGLSEVAKAFLPRVSQMILQMIILFIFFPKMLYKQKPKGLILKMLMCGNSASPGLPAPALPTPALTHSPLDCSLGPFAPV